MALMRLLVVAVLADVAPADGVATGNKSDNDNNTANDSLLQAFSLYSFFVRYYNYLLYGRQDEFVSLP